MLRCRSGPAGNPIPMRSWTAIGTALVALAVVFGASACGGSGSATKTNGVAGAHHTVTSASPAVQKQRIKQVWTEFFSGSTPAAKKASLLQHGSLFSAAIEAQSKSPLASKSSATVTNVTLQGPSKAKVAYSIDLGGKPALTHQIGLAVKSNGSWKVGDASFCSLLKLGGKPPSACAKLG